MSDNSNQPAFPMYNELGNLNAEGLTKREYFAGLAMQTYCLHPSYYTGDPKRLTEAAIKLADELLTQLSKTK